jgi:urease accessory protein
MTPERLLGLLQLADGLFPTGGFAHSFGLETYAQAGLVRDRAGLEAFLTAHLEGSAGPSDAVAVAVATRRAASADVAGCAALDAMLHASKCVQEFRDASQQMGRQAARVLLAIAEAPVVAAFAGAVVDGRTPGHHAVVFGAALGAAGVEPEAAATAFLHSTTALLVGAALRLLPLGQLDGQRALAAMRRRIARLAAVAARADADDLWGFAPGLELAGWRHAGLDSRLFRS